MNFLLLNTTGISNLDEMSLKSLKKLCGGDDITVIAQTVESFSITSGMYSVEDIFEYVDHYKFNGIILDPELPEYFIHEMYDCNKYCLPLLLQEFDEDSNKKVFKYWKKVHSISIITREVKQIY